jgi:hypothetical protein
MTYPPEPWSLRGRMRIAVWLVPVRDLPARPPELAGAVRLVRVGSRALVGAAWVEYEPGSVLVYRELLAAVLQRAGLAPRVTIVHIWVDSVASRDGGRVLWGIPKDLARFDFAGRTVSAELDGEPLAAATVRPGVRLPGRWPIGFRLVQSLHGAPKTSRVRATARLSLGRSQWTVPAGGPLRYVAGRRPVLTVTAADFRMTFGASSTVD